MDNWSYFWSKFLNSLAILLLVWICFWSFGISFSGNSLEFSIVGLIFGLISASAYIVSAMKNLNFKEKDYY